VAWQHAGFEELASDELRLAELRRHIGEVQLRMQQTVTDGELSVGSGSLSVYLGQLRSRLAELEARVGRAARGGPVRVRPGRST